MHAYIAAAGIAEDKKGWLFRTAKGHDGDKLADKPMDQADAWCMVRRRALAAGIMAPIGNHSFRATGITAYLANGGTLEHAQAMAAHESPRTTKLYDRTKERLTQAEVERVRFWPCRLDLLPSPSNCVARIPGLQSSLNISMASRASDCVLADSNKSMCEKT